MTVTNSSASIAKTLWTRGLDLAEIAYELARPDLRKIIRQPVPNPDEKRLREFPHDAPLVERFAASVKFFQPIFTHLSDRISAINEMRDEIIGLMMDGELLGFGYVLPRNPNDDPRVIPVDIWSGEIDWTRSAVSGNGLKFVAVRVLPLNSLPQTHMQGSPTLLEMSKRAPGRPSLKRYILDEFDNLEKAGEINYSKPMNACFPPIRSNLTNKYPGMADTFAKMADETIRVWVSLEFNRAKASKKQ